MCPQKERVMKKLLLFTSFVVAALAFSNRADAQTAFISNGTQLQYADKEWFGSTVVEAGYEFNEHWAIGVQASLSAHIQDALVAGLGGGGFVRYTLTHNDVLYLDLKALARGQYFSTDGKNMVIGISPSLRFRFAPRWEAFTDIGFFGARYADAYGWYPLLGFNPQSAVVGITYRFR